MRPNIITILVDDMGFSDPGCFGGEIDTPNLDRLAAAGVRFSQFYNTARCCPARASLLTGLYPHQAGVGLMVYRDCGPGYQGGINDRCVTFAEVLRDAGYQTMMSGKWHAGHEPQARPEVRGFESFTGVYAHIDSYWKVLKGCDVRRDGRPFIPAGENPTNPYRPEEEFYTTDFFTDVALDYLEQAAGTPQKPFLLHLCYNSPHFPLEAPDHLIEKYRGRYLKGWDVLRAEKLERMKAMGIVGGEQTLPRVRAFDYRDMGLVHQAAYSTDPLPEWESLSAEDREELDFRRAIYAAQIDRLDQNIGRIVDALFRLGVFDDTLILFMSDNGCSGEVGRFGMSWNRCRRENHAHWRKRSGWSISQGQCWASYSNTPLRKYKIFVHEGGIASPFIAHWPARIRTAGRIYGEPMFHLMDVMPTLCEAAAAEYPSAYRGRTVTPCQGISMLPFLTGERTEAPPRCLYWQHETNAAVREGNWKLVTENDRRPDRWELYDLSTDRSETEDLRAEHPELAAAMQRKWRRWAEKVHALPYPEHRNCRGIPLADDEDG